MNSSKVHPPRVVVLVDMDCFYVQVEQRKDPSLKEHPCAVVQGSGIIAVDYCARRYGVSRMVRGKEARRLCPDIRLVKVPEKRGKSDLTCYRDAGAEVISVLARFADRVERASIDEAFLDITERVAQRLCELGQATVTPEMLPATHVAGLCPREGGKCSGSASEFAGGSKHLVCPRGSTEGECSAAPRDSTEGEYSAAPRGSTEGEYSAGPLGSTEGEYSAGPLGSTEEECSAGPLGSTEGEYSAAPLGSPEGEYSAGPLGSTEGEYSAGPLGPSEGECLTSPLRPCGFEDEDFGFQDDLTMDESDGEVASEEGVGSSPSLVRSSSACAHLPSVASSTNRHCEDLLSWLAGEGSREERCLAVGALIATEMRRAVWEEAGFSCSAGIAHNKVLAKLAAGMNKPNQQTILPTSSIPAVFSITPFKKIRHLGGKLGLEVQRRLGIKYVGETQEHSLASLRRVFGDKTGAWLYDLCHGIDKEPVKTRTLPQSIGCGKNFPGPAKLKTAQKVLYWLEQLVEEVRERLAHDQKQNQRQAELLTVHFHPEELQSGVSRSCPLLSTDTPGLLRRAWAAMNKGHPTPMNVDPAGSTPLGWSSGITNLSLVASKFSPCPRLGSSVTLRSLLARNRTACVEAGGCLDSVGQGGGHSHEGPAPVPVEMSTASSSSQQEVPPVHRGSPADQQSPLGKRGRRSPSIKHYFCVSEDHRVTGPTVEDVPPSKCPKTADLAGSDVGGEGQCELCQRCQHWVPPDVWQEHSDFHLAQDLQQRLEAERVTEHPTHKPGSARRKDKGKMKNSIQKFLIKK